MTADEVRRMLRGLLKEHPSQTALAKKLKISKAYLSDVLGGTREPGDKLLKALGLKRTVDFAPAKSRRAA